MENIKRQTESGQCGIYNLANILRDTNIPRYASMEGFTPCGNPEINKILKAEGYNFRIEPLVSTVDHRAVIPQEFVITSLETFMDKHIALGEGDVLAFILCVQIGEGPKGLHAVALMEHKGRLIYSDPRREGFERIGSVYDIFLKCKYVNQIHCFATHEGYAALKPFIFDDDLEIFKR